MRISVCQRWFLSTLYYYVRRLFRNPSSNGNSGKEKNSSFQVLTVYWLIFQSVRAEKGERKKKKKKRKNSLGIWEERLIFLMHGVPNFGGTSDHNRWGGVSVFFAWGIAYMTQLDLMFLAQRGRRPWNESSISALVSEDASLEHPYFQRFRRTRSLLADLA